MFCYLLLQGGIYFGFFCCEIKASQPSVFSVANAAQNKHTNDT
jgi:hypothetical protein